MMFQEKNKKSSIVAEPNKGTRIVILDSLRGMAMIAVIVYHLLYDLKFIYGVDIPKVITPGSPEIEFVATCFLWILFGVSGICTGFSRDSLRRGVILYLIGWCITLVTSIFMTNYLIVFGVLSCFGACMILTALLARLLDKIPWKILLVISLILWIIFCDFRKSGEIHLIFTDIVVKSGETFKYLYPIGITETDFVSMDYFPIIPFIFMFWGGYALFRPVKDGKMPKWFYNKKAGVLSFMGKHSLIIYALHQVVILVLLEIIIGG